MNTQPVQTAPNRKPPSRVNAISKCKVDLLNITTLRAALSGYKQPWSEDSSAEELSVILAVYYADNFDTKGFPKCDVCGGSSDEHLDVCPFCGLDEAPLEVTPTSPPDELDRDGQVFATANLVPGLLVTPPSTTDIDASALPAVLYEEPKKPAKRGRPPTVKKVNGEVHSVSPSGLTLAGATGVPSVPDTRDLDARVERIISLKQDEAGSKWQMGKLIAEIGQRRLWTLRTKDEGKTAYKTFDAFCHNELFMTPTYAHLLADVANHFSEETVRAWGVRKLSPTLQLPEPERKLLLESKIKAGGYPDPEVSVKDIEREVRDIKAAGNIKARSSRDGSRRGGGEVQSAAIQSKAATKKGLAKVTVANMLGKERVKLFCKPTRVASFDPKTDKRAKKLADQPWGKLELTNDVVQYFTVVDINGELVLVVDTVRVEA